MSIAGRRRKMSRKIKHMRKQFFDMDKKTLRQVLEYLKVLEMEIRIATVGAAGWDAAHLGMIKDALERFLKR